MRLTASFISHEVRTQARSLRFRTAVVLYVLAGSFPAAAIHLRRSTLEYAIGGSTYASEVANLVALLTAVFAFLLSLDGITREQGEGAWTTVTLCEVSNAGYLLRRWLALQALILPLTVLPFAAAAGIAVADGAVLLHPLAFAGPWLLHIVPLALTASALGLGIGTIGGGALRALPLLAIVLALVPLLANQLLHRFGLRFVSPLGWVGFPEAMWTLSRMVQSLTGRESPYGWTFPIPSSEAGFDARVIGEQLLARGAFFAALAALALGAAAVYLRRTRPDVRPLRVRPDHPVRGFLLTYGKLRERYKPDPAPAPADRLALTAGLLAAAALLGLLTWRGLSYESLAETRFSAETQGKVRTTPAGVVPGRWRVEGRIGPGQTVAFQVSGEMVNQGEEPAGYLAFQLNPRLEIEVTADSGRVILAREWDRLGLELEPPIPPGGRRELRFQLSGEPSDPVFVVPPGPGTFAGHYILHRDALYGRDRLPFAYSFLQPAVSGYRVELSQGSLVPVPRYGAWMGKTGPASETVFPRAEVELSLSGPPGLFLADTCGGIVRNNALASRCRTALSDLAVVGGRYRLLQGEVDGTAVAVYPAHTQAAELHLGFLAHSAGMLDEAWPGTGSLGRLVVLEWPHQEIHYRGGAQSLGRWYREPSDSFLDVKGNLVFLQETDLIGLKGLAPEHLAAEILAVRLADRRRIVPEHNLFFRKFLQNLALERLGLGERSGAVVGPLHPSDEAGVQVPAFAKDLYYGYWHFRLPALVAALESRMGAEPLRAAVEEFLSRGDDPGTGPGTAEELFELLARHSPQPVERLIQEFFIAGDLPYPVLEGVEFRRAGDDGGNTWRVTGRMVNQGKGEALCQVVLNTDLGPESTILSAGTGESAGFAFATRHRPQAVFLDPNRECHRLVRKGPPRDLTHFEGDGK
ncbi:MAG TPA: hypothetical protein VNW71_03905 [Thermoanaerobaculia bacterium]|nr:hypothetical protein [Thermoanaerobaculia bacterium]